MSRAVPSPPANSSRSTPAHPPSRARRPACPGRSSSRAATPTTSTSKPRAAARSAPIARRGGGHVEPCPLGLEARERPVRARGRRDGSRRARSARRWTSAPSRALQPDRPPMPAIGLTINPSRRRGMSEVAIGQFSRRSSSATWSVAARATSTIVIDLALGDHERRRERDRVGGRKRARDHAALEAGAGDARGDAEVRVEGARRIARLRRTRRPRSARGRAPRRRADGRRTRRAAASRR